MRSEGQQKQEGARHRWETQAPLRARGAIAITIWDGETQRQAASRKPLSCSGPTTLPRVKPVGTAGMRLGQTQLDR
eukprot:1444446-Pyramimonas_sp.AAC.1